jgi:hypothetical protein
MELQDALSDYDLSFLDPKSKAIPEIDKRLREQIYEVFSGVLTGIFIKSGFSSPVFMQTLKAWFLSDQDASPIKNIISFIVTFSTIFINTVV